MIVGVTGGIGSGKSLVALALCSFDNTVYFHADKEAKLLMNKSAIIKDKIKPSDLATYLEDANFVLLNSEVIGAEVYKSVDGGKSWRKTHEDYLDDVYSSYGYYFGVIAVNTSNENKIYVGGVPLLKSDDAGKTFNSIGKENVHSDHQALWVNAK